MILTGCTCSWGIPGIERLPVHNHLDVLRVRNADDGREIEAAGVIPDRTWQLVSQEERIVLWVSWRDVARALTVDPS